VYVIAEVRKNRLMGVFAGVRHRIESHSVVNMATGYGLDNREVEVRVPVDKNFHFSIPSRPALGPI
jgi:hypothetical protein